MSDDPHTPRDSAAPSGRLETTPDHDPRGERPNRTRQNIVVIAITAALIGAGIWLAHVISDARKLQDCLLSGRTNCAPVDVDSR